MYSYVKQVRSPCRAGAGSARLPASFVIAEVFYKFHSFTLECAAFLVTWFGSAGCSPLILGSRAK